MPAQRALFRIAALVAVCGSTPTFADFSGQTILGPLNPGSVVNGNLIGAGDENDGWFSGTHIFDIWNGGDDVWQLLWPGGDLTLTLTYTMGDPDLFLYTPGNLDESSFDSINGPSPDVINVPNATAGTYYVLVDTAAGGEGPYELSVSPIPAPGALALLGVGGLFASRRRQRR